MNQLRRKSRLASDAESDALRGRVFSTLALSSATLAGAFFVAAILSIDERSVTPALIYAEQVGFEGLDPVELSLGQHIRGSARWTASHHGVEYRFANALNRRLFETVPEIYAMPDASTIHTRRVMAEAALEGALWCESTRVPSAGQT